MMHFSGINLAIIQARMTSSRLPGKVMMDISGQPMLARVVDRVKRARKVSKVIVATTSDSTDDPIVEFCDQRGYSVWRGDQFNVLDRYYQAAKSHQAHLVVRITADCPVVDPGLIDETIAVFSSKQHTSNLDFAANRFPPPWRRTFPIGLDVEVFTFLGLQKAWREADQQHHREHVTTFFYEGIKADADVLTQPVTIYESPRGFRVAYLNHKDDFGSLRWTVDTHEDLTLIRRIYDHFTGRDDFSWLEILELFDDEPQLALINSIVRHKTFNEYDQRADR